MENPTKAMLSAIVIVLVIALSLHLWTWLEPACSNESRRLIMKAAGGVGCFEFWLNRYQTLAGSIIAVAAAIGFGIPAWKNLLATNRQATLANLAFGSALLADREADISAVGNLSAHAKGLLAIIDGLAVGDIDADTKMLWVKFLNESFDPMAVKVEELGPRGTCWGFATTRLRNNFLQEARTLVTGLIQFKTAVLGYGTAADMNAIALAAQTVTASHARLEGLHRAYLISAIGENAPVISAARRMQQEIFPGR